MAKSKKPVGRPVIEITDELCTKAEKLAATGITQYQIAAVLGMGQTTYYEKVRDYPQFLKAISDGQAKGITQVTNAVFKKAVGGDMVAAKYYLNNRDNPNWREKVESTVIGADGGAIKTDITWTVKVVE